ncbi:hypothetical protein [Dysgonomonas massiliensis]|uniref:hypothetical protein n=1 Tax=Dysgonomonas massiliensis TaxID=2040292 RepID=UPI000C7848AD|nr:hypothetical protein [Dysgonomonas massiliensis]
MITIGNIKGVRQEHQITVFRASDNLPYLQFVLSNDARVKNEIMNEHYLESTFNYTGLIEMKIGDYCTYNGIKYALMKDFTPEQVRDGEYRYTIRFDAPEMFFKNVPNFYTLQGFNELEWSLRERPERFMQLFVENINDFYNNDWKVGIVEPTELLDLSFSNSYVFDALTQLAEATKCEWYPDYQLKTLSLVSRLKIGNTPIVLESGDLLNQVRRDSQNKDYCTRLYAFGGTQNIPLNYRKPIAGEAIDAIVQKRLRMPLSTGDYIDIRPNLKPHEIVPKFVNFDIFPQRVGTITEIREVERKDEQGNKFSVFYFKDSGINFDTKYILPNETLKCVFQDGWMAGFDREISYNNKTKEYEIINEQLGEQLIPNAIIRPKVGDKYVLYNFNISMVGDQYVPEAERELERQAKEYLAEMFDNSNTDSDIDTYTCVLNPVEVAEQEVSLVLGQSVSVISDAVKGGQKDSRVYGYTKFPVTRKDEYLIGDSPKYSRFASVEKTAENNKRELNVQIADAMRQANNAYRDIKALNYIRTALQNETTIDGGLILTTLIQMGLMQGDTWLNTAGVNGVRENDNDIAFWGGGTLEQAINAVKNPEAIEDVANFVVTHGGKTIQNNALIRGKFESSLWGSKIIIDPYLRKIEFFSSISEKSGGSWTLIDVMGANKATSSIEIPSSDGNFITKISSGLSALSTTGDGSQSHFNNKTISLYGAFGTNTEFSASTEGDILELIIKNLPKSDIYLKEGQAWLDNGLIRVKESE